MKGPLLHPTAIHSNEHLCCCCMLKTLGPRLPCNQLLYILVGSCTRKGKTRLEATVHSFNECSVTKLGVSHREKKHTTASPSQYQSSARNSDREVKQVLKLVTLDLFPPNQLHLEWSLKSKPKHNRKIRKLVVKDK